MASILETIQRLFNPAQAISPGVYHYQAPPDDPRNYRLHLRLEPDGSGILIVNAATVLHLNQTAAEYAYYLIQNLLPEQVSRKMAARYQVSPDQARQDYQDLTDRIQILINTPDLDPVTFLDFERQKPFTGNISAPYRLDCAITYQLPENISPVSAPTERVKRELETSEWKTILNKAWEAGIPHIIFTGGEPTLREDLPELIGVAEANSQVTGLLSDGLRLADKTYLAKLLQTGLDHMMLIFQDGETRFWKALENTLAEDVFVAVHLSITQANSAQIPALLDQLSHIGVKAISLSSSDSGLNAALQSARDKVASLNLELLWNLPVPYSAHNPVTLETGTGETLEGAGRAWLYIEPDGDVLPAQGVQRVMGNILLDPWNKIWKVARG